MPKEGPTCSGCILDHNATTPVHPAVVEAMTKVLREDFGNPSSVHHFGQRAKSAMDRGPELGGVPHRCRPV